MNRPLLIVALLSFSACGPKAATPATATTTAKPAVAGAANPGRIDPATVPAETRMRASRGADPKVLYVNMLAAVYAPEDQHSYSAYDEYGWKNAGDYKTYGSFPAGWWVYSAPYWIVWDLKNGQRGS